jgi:hypothetical protein
LEHMTPIVGRAGARQKAASQIAGIAVRHNPAKAIRKAWI